MSCSIRARRAISQGVDPAAQAEEWLTAFADLVGAGKVAAVGTSNFCCFAGYGDLLSRLRADRGFQYDSSLMDDDRPYLSATAAHAPWSNCPSTGRPTTGSSTRGCLATTTAGRSRPRARSTNCGGPDIEAHIRYGGLFNLVNHPFVSGRAARVVAMEEMLERLLSDERIWFTTLGEITDFAASLALPPRHHQPYTVGR